MDRRKVADAIGRAPRGLNDGKGFVFISHRGDVFPSGFLPFAAGSIREQSLSAIYRESPLFRDLRDTSKLEGKCGACEFKHICGGIARSRLRAQRQSLWRRIMLQLYSARIYPSSHIAE